MSSDIATLKAQLNHERALRLQAEACFADVFAKNAELRMKLEPLCTLADVAASSEKASVPPSPPKPISAPREFTIRKVGKTLLTGDDVYDYFVDIGLTIGRALRDTCPAEPMKLGRGRIYWQPTPAAFNDYRHEIHNPYDPETLHDVAFGRLTPAFSLERDLFANPGGRMKCCSDTLPSLLGLDSTGWRENSFTWGRRAISEGVVKGYYEMTAQKGGAYQRKVNLCKAPYRHNMKKQY